MKTEIIEVKEALPEYLQAIQQLLPELTPHATPLDESTWQELVAHPSTRIFLLKANEQIAGMLTLGHYTSPTGRKYWVEDVTVSAAYRGKGLGRILLQHAIAEVKKQAPATLMLTSKPARIAANQLYQSSGFSPKETNVYVMKLPK